MERVDPAHDLRKGLTVRLAIAAGVLVAGLVGLAWLGGAPPDATQQASGTLGPSEAVSPAQVDAPPSIEAAAVGSSPPSVAEGGLGAATLAASEESARTVTEPSAAPAAAVPDQAVDAADDKALVLERSKHAVAQPKNKPTRGPHLQAGVFMQPANAEEFKAKLEAEGLPVYIESRVQIGPFKNRKEAERMREKLKTQGLTTVLISQ